MTGPVHEGDVVTVRGRAGVWRVLWVRRGAARVTALDGTGGVRATTVDVGLLAPYGDADEPAGIG